MRWRDLGITVALLLFFAPWLTAQTIPVALPSNTAGSFYASTAFTTGSAGKVCWSSTTSPSGTPDACLVRNGAASLTTTNGSTGPAALSLAGTTRVLALPAGALGVATVSTASVGNTGQGGRLVLVCGPAAGTGSWLLYTGTSNTPTVLANGVGAGLIGC